MTQTRIPQGVSLEAQTLRKKSQVPGQADARWWLTGKRGTRGTKLEMLHDFIRAAVTKYYLREA